MLLPGSSTSSLVALTQFQLADVSQTGYLAASIVQGSGIGPCLFILYTMHLKPLSAFNSGRPLSVSGRPCYILPMFIYLFFFMAALFSGPG